MRYIWSQPLFTEMASLDREKKSPGIKGVAVSLASFSLLHYNSQNWPSDLVPEGINDKWRTAVPWPSESQRLPPCVGCGAQTVCA